MLRGWLLLLLGANLAFWAYTQGYLALLGLTPHNPREPHRVSQQVFPEAIRLLHHSPPAEPTVMGPPVSATPGVQPNEPLPRAAPIDSPEALSPADAAPVGTPARASASPLLPATCWIATGLSEAQQVLVRAALRNMDGVQDRWSLQPAVVPARWIVYTGPFPSVAALQQRRAEFRRLGLDHRDVSAPGVPPGLALGTYSTQAGAQRAADALQRTGVSGLRVLQERADTPVYTLRIDGVTETQRRRIEAMGILPDRSLQRCP